MKRFKVLHWLTALALLMGQWGMFVHAAEHGLHEADDTLCVVCVQGHNLQQLQVNHATVITFDRSMLAPAETAATQTLSARTARSTIRAPPLPVHN
ncbi:MAG: hypothetical protein R3352_07150 [Salinisphaeraceae bacterium]|nr:hypothetical protein [Salinisphaeraceae bacterium]